MLFSMNLICCFMINVLAWQSIEQIGNRAQRMRITTNELFLYSSTDIEVFALKSSFLSTKKFISAKLSNDLVVLYLDVILINAKCVRDETCNSKLNWKKHKLYVFRKYPNIVLATIKFLFLFIYFFLCLRTVVMFFR